MNYLISYFKELGKLKKVLRKTRKSRLMLYGFILVALIPVAIFIAKKATQTEAAWYNEGWGYRTKITIDNSKVGGANELFDIGHETGDLSEYDTTAIDGGDLSVSTAAALNGSSYGLSALIDDNNQIEGRKNVNTATKARYRFYFDPNSITMANGDLFRIQNFIQDGGGYQTIVSVSLRYYTASGYRFEIVGNNDADTSPFTDNLNITDAPHYIEVYATQAANSGSSDGAYEWWVDGVSQGSGAGIDNYNVMSDYNWRTYLTAYGIDTGTRGAVYYDDFVINDDGSPIGPVLTDFPVYVDLSDLPPGFHSNVNQTDARDIRVTKADGATELPREVVYYDSAADTGELHFQFTGTLSSTVDTEVYIYYGNPSANDYAVTDTYGAENVWDSNYSGIHHVDNDSFLDSTATSSDGTNNNSTNATGNMGDGRLMDADGEYFYVPMSGYIHASVNTIEWWYKSTTTPASYSSFFNSSEGGDELTFSRNAADTTLALNLNSTNYIDWTSLSTNVFDGNWHHVTVVLDTVTNTEEIYIDGTARGQKTQNPANIDISTYNFLLGGNTSSAPVNGIMDEVRVSNNYLRSSTWLGTQYNNQNSPSTFYTVASEEDGAGKHAILHFGFDEGYGTTAKDSSPNGYNGTLTGTTTPSWQAESMCIAGKCLFYEGSTAYTNVASSVSNVQSVSFWVRPKTNSEYLVDFDGGTHYISASSGTVTATGFSSPTIFVNAVQDAPLVANDWNHVEVTTATKFTANNITIGKQSTNFLTGFIDEFKIYDYARTAAEVKTDFVKVSNVRGVSTSFTPDQSYLTEGLVGYWKMDDNTGTTTTDSSGNGKTGTLENSPVWASGKFGTGIDYTSASSQYLSTANQQNHNTQTLTVAAWIKPDNLAGSTRQAIVSDSGWGNNGYRIVVKPDTDGIEVSLGNGLENQFNVNTVLSNNAWQHVAFTFNKPYVTVYLNGEIIGSDTFNSDITQSTDSLFIGKTTNTNWYFDGTLDEVRIYNRALSPSEVSKLYSWAPGPVGHWKMDEKTGQYAYDNSGNSNNAILGSSTGINSSDPTWTNGKYGSGLSFDGSEDYAYVADNALLTPPHDMTLEFWFKLNVLPSTAGYTYNLVKKSNSTSPYESYVASINTSNVLAFKWENPTGSGDTSTWYNYIDEVDTWYHAVFVKSGSDIYTYVNGAKSDGDGFNAGAYLDSDQPLHIGANAPNNSNWTDGIIDEIKLYNYARTSQQIIEDMNGGHPAPGSPVGSAIAHWDFDEGADNTCSGGTNDVCNSGSDGNNLDGAETGMAIPATATSGWTSDGKFGKALNFDGSNDNISIGDKTSLEFADGTSFTSSFWVKSPITSTGTILAKKTSTTAGTSGYDFRLSSSNTLDAYFSDGTDQYQLTKSNAVTANTWTHVVVVYDDASTTNTDIYINGVKSGSTPTGTLSNINDVGVNTQPLKIGSEADNQDYFLGTIDELQFFRSALTADQVKLLYNQGSAAVMGASSTDSSGNADNSSVRMYCPPGNTEGRCGSGDPSPITHWKMDEPSLTQDCTTANGAKDSSGNYNAASCPSGIGPTGGEVGIYSKAVMFDKSGGSHYLNPGDINELDGASAFTLDFWIKFNTLAAWDGIFQKYVNSNNRIHIQQGSSVGSLYAIVANGASTYGYINSVLSENKWFHISIVFDGSGSGNADRLKMYINGIQQTLSWSGTIPATTNNNSAQVNIGTSSKEIIDDMRIYNYARTPAQVAWDYNQGAPIAHWDFDECSGAIAYDSALKPDRNSTRYDGTIVPGGAPNTSVGQCSDGAGATMWGDGQTGKFNGSLGFDGTDDVVTISNTSVLDHNEGLKNGFTYSAWIYPNSVGEGIAGRIFSKINASDYAVLCNLQNESSGQADVRCRVWTAITSDYYTATTKVTLNQWNHVALSWTKDNDDEITIWVNGIPNESSGINSGYPQVESSDLYIGNSYLGTLTFDGKIDDFRIYNYALSPQQIKTVMNLNSAVRFGQ